VSAGADAPQRRGSRVLIALLVLVVIAAAAAFAGYTYIKTQFSTVGPFTEDQVFIVPTGAGASRIASELEKTGLIESADVYKLALRIENRNPKLIPGEFSIPAGASMAEITEILESGKIIQYKFTAPEGLTSTQIVRLMDSHEVLIDDDPEVPAEGVLLPETYLFARGMTQSGLLAQMEKAQSDALDTLWPAREAGLPLKSPQEARILASIVEKETGVDGERHKVAGVFINRLRRGMRLESDPTIIYGISKGEPLGRGLRRSEIDRKTDWNTYQIDGLPPTPIANPGQEALKAVLNPAETEALFFVADGTGGHAFAKTYREHLRNVAKWRQIERQRR